MFNFNTISLKLKIFDDDIYFNKRFLNFFIFFRIYIYTVICLNDNPAELEPITIVFVVPVVTRPAD